MRRPSNRKRPPPPPLPIGVIACRTRSKKRAIAAKWDILPIPIIIQIISWLDQQSLMSLSLVSKQCHNIICNEPGNKNKIIPVFEVSGCSKQTLFKNIRDYSLNNETNKKLRRYSHMKVNNANAFDDFPGEMRKKIAKDVQMDWIKSLDLSLPYQSTRKKTVWLDLPFILSRILPKLLELDLSNNSLHSTLLQFSWNCHFLEKITCNNIAKYSYISLSGSDMRLSDHLKEIYMDNSNFRKFNNEYADLINHQEIFLFHLCCESLERVSIRNMIYSHYDYMPDSDDDKEQQMIFIQNLLIKFVRNAPTTLHWFRSDLTKENIVMLQKERLQLGKPVIEFL
ncbi:MAG: hypothetical protein ACI90V_012073 [Bacillariaceae sp.]|jgi:hypothetical protein